MNRILVAFTCFSLSCGPDANRDPNQLHRVGAAELVGHFRDGKGHVYTGRKVQVRVPPLSYTSQQCEVHYRTGLPHSGPVIVFRCVEVQPDERDAELIITGQCLGAVPDGERKMDRVYFHIVIESANVTRLAR